MLEQLYKFNSCNSTNQGDKGAETIGFTTMTVEAMAMAGWLKQPR